MFVIYFFTDKIIFPAFYHDDQVNILQQLMKTTSKFLASVCKCNGALKRHLSTAMQGKKSTQLITGVHTLATY